jgi:hypothetical protein
MLRNTQLEDILLNSSSYPAPEFTVLSTTVYLEVGVR